MGLVADALEEVEALAGAGQDDRVVLAGDPDLLQALGEAADGDVVDAQFVQGPLRGGDLGLAAVDHDELRRVGEPLGAAVLVGEGGGDLAALRGVLLLGPLAGALPVAQVAAETAGDHLVHRADVVLALAVPELGVVEARPLIWKRRYSLLRASPSSKTTIEATTSSPWKWEMS